MYQEAYQHCLLQAELTLSVLRPIHSGAAEHHLKLLPSAPRAPGLHCTGLWNGSSWCHVTNSGPVGNLCDR